MYRVTKTTNMYRSCEDGTPRSAGREIPEGTQVELLYVDGKCARIQLPDGSKVFFPREFLEPVQDTPPEEPPGDERYILFFPGDGTQEKYVPENGVG